MGAVAPIRTPPGANVKRTHRIRRTDDEGVNLTPMLDVVFIMLIFFIVTASFIKEYGIEINRPDASPQTLTNREVILVTISATDQVWIGGRSVDLRSIRANMERMLAEKPDAQVVIRADASCTNGAFVSVLDQARQAGAANVSLAAAI
jgi:biopolymer transport protein ExbD